MKWKSSLDNPPAWLQKRLPGLAGSDGFYHWLGWIYLTIIFCIGALLATLGLKVIPGYDGASYLQMAFVTHQALASSAEAPPLESVLPFTNTLDVLLVGLFWDWAPYNLLVMVIHSAYLVFFWMMLSRVLQPPAAAMLLALSLGTGYLFSQYLNLLSELKIGLLLSLLLVYLFAVDARKVVWSLFWISLLLVFLRLAAFAFLAVIAAIYLVWRWRNDTPWEKARVIAALTTPLILRLALFPGHLAAQYNYLSQHTGQWRHVWQQMSGVHNHWELLGFYGRALLQYNPVFVFSSSVMVLLALSLLFSHLRTDRSPAAAPDAARIIALFCAILGLFAVLAVPGNPNINLAYWPFVLLTTGGALVMHLNYRKLIAPGALAAVPVAIATLVPAIDGQLEKLEIFGKFTPLALELSEAVSGLNDPAIFQNFAGVAPLDTNAGLTITSGKPLILISRNGSNLNGEAPDTAEVEQILRKADVLLLARENYFWPSFVGINQQTAAFHALAVSMAVDHGFRQRKQVYLPNDPEKSVEVWSKSPLAPANDFSRWNNGRRTPP